MTKEESLQQIQAMDPLIAAECVLALINQQGEKILPGDRDRKGGLVQNLLLLDIARSLRVLATAPKIGG